MFKRQDFKICTSHEPLLRKLLGDVLHQNEGTKAREKSTQAQKIGYPT